MISDTDLANALQAVTALLPFGKNLPPLAYVLAYDTLPEEAKRDLTPAMLSYAVGQFLLDPDRPKDCPIHLAMLRYVYRLENDWPNFRWGLKPDLPARMAQPALLHPQGVEVNYRRCLAS